MIEKPQHTELDRDFDWRDMKAGRDSKNRCGGRLLPEEAVIVAVLLMTDGVMLEPCLTLLDGTPER